MDDFIKRQKKVSNYIEAQEDNVDQLVEEITEYKSQLQDSSGVDRLEVESNLAFIENELRRLEFRLKKVRKAE